MCRRKHIFYARVIRGGIAGDGGVVLEYLCFDLRVHHMKLEHPLIGMVINFAKKDIVFC